jgi:hypothetical protein
MWRYDVDWFNSDGKLDCCRLLWRNAADSRELLLSIFRKHSNKDVNDNLELSSVCGGALDEDIASLGRNLRMVSVDDRRKRADHAV